MSIELTIEGNALCFGPHVRVTFQRTLRIPDDGNDYPLPPGLGAFPLRRVADYASQVPEDWRAHGGVFLPMYQREAMWLRLDAPDWRPHALKVAVGKVCAITGAPWRENLRAHPQDYVVVPPQPWLDGIASGRGRIRQFVAMPLGLGYTVEGQVSGEERFGGIQLKLFEPRPGLFSTAPPPPRLGELYECCSGTAPARCAPPPPCAAPAGPPRRHAARRAGAMGLAAGGRMRQKVYPDPHGLEAWNPAAAARVFVHIVNSELWREITGETPPPTPVTARAYADAGLPWFDLYDEGLASLSATSTLSKVQSVKQLDESKSTLPLQDDATVAAGPVHGIPVKGKAVRDGSW